MASVDNDAQYLLCVAKRHSTKRNVIVAKGHLLLIRTLSVEQLARLIVIKAALEFINQVVRSINGHAAIKVLNRLLHVLECAPEVLRHALVLQIRFSVQVLGLNVGNALVFGAAHEQHVCWEKLILVYSNEVSDLNFTPGHLLESAC